MKINGSIPVIPVEVEDQIAERAAKAVSSGFDRGIMLRASSLCQAEHSISLVKIKWLFCTGGLCQDKPP